MSTSTLSERECVPTKNMSKITITEEDNWFIITDEESGVTTQGESKLEALLMLADALAGHEDSAVDLLAMAVDVFIPDPEDHEFLADLADEEYDPPDVSQEQVERQREAALWLAKSHKTTDYSDPHRFNALRALIYGQTNDITIDRLRELIDKEYWDVFDAIATGARTAEEITAELAVSEDHVRDAIRNLTQMELITEADDGSLYATQPVVGINPYPIDEENVIDWADHYGHTLVRTIDEDELPARAEEGVFVERQGAGYGWYHDPASYTSQWTDEVLLSQDEAEQAGAKPCPRCFPDTEYGKMFDVIKLPGGVIQFAAKDHDDSSDKHEGDP